MSQAVAAGGAAGPAVASVARRLQTAGAGRLRVLTGLRLIEPRTGQWVPLDLVVITDTAAAVGVAAPPGPPAEPTPQAAALAVVRVQRERGLAPQLPVYAFWLGAAAPPGYAGGAPALADAEAVERFIQHVEAAHAGGGAPQTAEALVELLRALDVRPVEAAAEPGDFTLPRARRPVFAVRAGPGLGRAWQALRGLPARLDAALRQRIRQPLWAGRGQPVRPADVRERLEQALFDAGNLLEDARYLKIAPNDFVVELSRDNY
jgi:hypothetical protein